MFMQYYQLFIINYKILKMTLLITENIVIKRGAIGINDLT